MSPAATRSAIVVAALIGACAPLLNLPAFYESFLYLVLHWAVLATSWNILSGYSGYFSFGHGAFFGAGMYATAVLASRFDWPFLATLPAGALIAALLGVGVGAVVFRVGRLRGELFALLTLAVSYVLATIVLNTPIDGGPGVYLSAVPMPAIASSPAATFYLLVLALATASLLIAHAIRHGRLGLGLFAIHDDEDVAEVLGVPTRRYKLIALALSGALAGAAGGIHALFVSYVTVGETFSIVVPLYVILMSVLGGSRHWLGPAVGAAAVTALLYAFTAGELAIAGRALTGLVLIGVILFLPDGVLGRWTRRGWSPQLAPAAARPPGDPPDRTGREAAAHGAGASRGRHDRPHAQGAETGRPILLEVRGVSKAFRGVQALSAVDIDVRAGEILGLVGPNGSGKSTLINVISGHYRADAGTIALHGRSLAGTDAHAIARTGIARTYQIPRPFARLSVLDNVMLPAMFGRDALAAGAARDEAFEWLRFAGLAEKADALPQNLNLHQRKFLELARALAARPELLMLDEVLSGLTPTEIDGAIGLIRSIRDRGTTIVFVEHVIRAVMALTDRLVVLQHGRVIASGLPAEVMRAPAVITAYLGQRTEQRDARS